MANGWPCRRLLTRLLAVQSALSCAYLLSQWTRRPASTTETSTTEASPPPAETALPDLPAGASTFADDYTRHAVQRRPALNDVTSFQYVIANEASCRDWQRPAAAQRRRLLVVVVSAAANAAKRDAVRRTWASPLTNSTHLGAGWARYVFFTGLSHDDDANRALLDEQRRHSDIVQVKKNILIKFTGVVFTSDHRKDLIPFFVSFRLTPERKMRSNTASTFLSCFQCFRCVWPTTIPI